MVGGEFGKYWPSRFVVMSIRGRTRFGEQTMRNILLAGSAGLLVAFSAAGVANANNPNVPIWSPYSLNTNVGAPARHPMHRVAKATKMDAPIFSNGSSDENYMVPDSTSAANGATNVPGGQAFGAPENPAER
jgi:hypothetical protein